MKISELITELQKYKIVYGDLECVSDSTYSNHGASSTFQEEVELQLILEYKSYFTGVHKEKALLFY